MKFSLILLAAGSGSRMNLGYNKMMHTIDGMTILEKCLKTFLNHNSIDEIIVVINKDDEQEIAKSLKGYPIKYTYGGNERYDSVYNGLQIVSNDYVLIHDGARCFINDKLINDIVEATIKYDAATLAVPAKDTIHLVDDESFIQTTVNRNRAYLAQTPQGFKTTLIKNIYDILYPNVEFFQNITDDAMLVHEIAEHKVRIVKSDYSNLKVTTVEDIRND